MKKNLELIAEKAGSIINPKSSFRKWIVPLFLILVTLILFFYPVFFDKVPFPGDLLLGEYAPYSSYEFMGYNPGGFPNKAQNFDVLQLLYPTKEYSIEMLKQFKIPLWNPYIFSGTPHLAAFQSGTFYPLNIIFFIFSFENAWILYILVQPLLASIFTFFLLREFKLNLISSIFGGIVFGFSSYMTVWMQYGNLGHSILWLPLIMLVAYKNVQKITFLKSVMLVFLLSISMLAGYIQISFYLFVFVGFFVFYLTYSAKENKIKKCIFFSTIIILPVFLTAFQLLPTFELFINSARKGFTYSELIKLLIPKLHLISLFAPDFFGNPATRNYFLTGTYIERVSYIGVIPLIFALYAIFFIRSNRLVKFFIFNFFIILCLSFDTVISRIFYSANLPIISTSVPSRIMFLFCFTGSTLSAFGLDLYAQEKKNKNLFKTVFPLGIICLLLWLYVYIAPSILDSVSLGNINISRRNIILPSIILFSAITLIITGMFFKHFKKYAILMFLIITVFDLFYFFQKITPFSPRETIYPKTPVLKEINKLQNINRMWGYGSARVAADISVHEKFYSTDGYDALYIKRYGEFVESSKNGIIESSLISNTANLAPGFGENDLRRNLNRQKILNITGTKYILHKKNSSQDGAKHDFSVFDDDKYKLIWHDNAWQIYENLQVAPRVFLTSDFIVISDKESIIKEFHKKTFNENKTLILEEDPNLKKNLLKLNKVEINSYTPNEVLIKTYSDAESMLFISDSYYPGWKAHIDDNETKIYRADYVFRAIKIPEGEHLVKFSYISSSFNTGVIISFLTVVTILLIYLFRKSIKLNI